MKKLTALLLALLMTLSFVTALADISPAQMLGNWYTDKAEDRGKTYQLLDDYHLEINRDSTAKLVLKGSENTYNWKIAGNKIVLTDSEGAVFAEFDYENDALSAKLDVDDNKYGFVFTREQPEAFVIPEVKDAEAEDEFFGDWQVAYSVAPAGAILASDEDAALGIKVEFAQISLTKGDSTVYALTNFEYGKLTFNAADLGLGDGTVNVELADNGYARITLDGVPEETFNYYLVKLDAAPAAE